MSSRDGAPGVTAAVLENMTVAVLVFDEALRLDYLNPSAENLMQLSARRAHGKKLPKLFPGAGEFHQRIIEAIDTAHPFTERELALRLYAGQRVTLDCTVTPLQGTGGATSLLIELVQVDRQMRISREEGLLAQSNAARELARGLAHEIKNPLGGLRGAAQLLERELPREELREYTRIIIGEADRLQKLIDRMLGPRALPEPRSTGIHALLQHVLGLLEAERHPGLVIERDYDPSIPDLMIDSDMILQALLNLVRNAVEAMSGEGVLRVRTRTQRQFTIGHQRHKLVLQVDIADTGPGVDEGMLDKIFMPMVTGRAEGTGLGLSIAQSLVNHHGGLIECESVPGDTVFTMYIPIGVDR